MHIIMSNLHDKFLYNLYLIPDKLNSYNLIDKLNSNIT